MNIRPQIIELYQQQCNLAAEESPVIRNMDIFTNATAGLHKYSEMMRDDDGSKKAIAGYPAKYINYDGNVYFCSIIFQLLPTDRIDILKYRKISAESSAGNSVMLPLCWRIIYISDYLSKP